MSRFLNSHLTGNGSLLCCLGFVDYRCSSLLGSAGSQWMFSNQTF